MIQRLIKSNSTNPNYHHLYANILYNMGDCDGRCRESKLALDLNPDNVYYETNRYQCIWTSLWKELVISKWIFEFWIYKWKRGPVSFMSSVREDLYVMETLKDHIVTYMREENSEIQRTFQLILEYKTSSKDEVQNTVQSSKEKWRQCWSRVLVLRFAYVYE